MEFVERGVSRGEKESENEHAFAVHTQGAREQRGQNRVFRHVAAFANDQLDGADGRVRNIWREPAEERPDEARRVFGRKQIG